MAKIEADHVKIIYQNLNMQVSKLKLKTKFNYFVHLHRTEVEKELKIYTLDRTLTVTYEQFKVGVRD